ncbi:MAG: TetR/AcrR family transcriptional regulator [Caulobacteraceae bacterium]
MKPVTTPRTQPTSSAAKARGAAATAVPGLRARRAAERRAAIVDAALDLFSSRGFAATRMEDVAAAAGVAKGTVYLNFTDKEALFEGIVRTVIGPTVNEIQAVDFAAIPCVREAIERVALPGIRELTTSRRGDVMRLIVSEGERFPRLAEFYYSEVIGPGVVQLRRLLHRAVETGEIADASLAEFPHLLVAPVFLAVLWHGLYRRLAPLDVEGLLAAHLDVLFGPPRRASRRSDPP